MSGVFGYVGAGAPGIADAMARTAGRLERSSAKVAGGYAHLVGATGHASVAALVERQSCVLALYGHPFIDQEGRPITTIGEVALTLASRLANEGRKALDSLGGDFCLAYAEPQVGRLLLATDRMAIRNVVYAVGSQAVFGPDCDTVTRHPAIAQELDPQQLYHYLYFHMVPGPGTIYRNLKRVPPGHCVEFLHGASTVHRYWQMPFDERVSASFSELRPRFRAALETAVASYAHSGRTGTFLSGGTDSSTISGVLARQQPHAIPAFSIGFDASGYDEMEYARIAAKHFGLDHHSYYVTPDDVVSAVPQIAQAYDQPFGNSSAVPTFFCAKLARDHGVDVLLAGDGGDELFGGNVRYARQQQFAYYDYIPRWLRRGLLDPAIRRVPGGAPSLLRKARSYVEQASMPMPDRYESYNLLQRMGPASIFTDDFLDGIDPAGPLAHQREVYRDTNAVSLINRMLSFDFQYTLADNDLPKVTRMCELAGVDVAFPMLDDGVVAFSATLAPDMKLRGTQLRYFFKRALADFLPPQIIAKEKHGFGLPFGVWLTTHPRLRELAADSLAGLRTRGFVRPEFIARLLDHDVNVHPGYYGSMVWVLMMLEQWYRRSRRS